MTCSRSRVLVVVLTCASACGSCTTPASTAPAPSAAPIAKGAWDTLCPAHGASDALSIVASEDVAFEPSGAAVVGDRVALLGDKQPALWWWRPGARDVVRDPAFTIAGTAQTDPRSCCATAELTWGTAIKRERAHETCDAHGVKLGTPLAWLKGEALATTGDTIYVAGNMGFDCVDNEVRALKDGVSTHVAGLDRSAVLAALAAVDLRVEGFALADDARTALVGVRQITRGADPDSKDVSMVRKVVVATRADASAPFAITHVSDVGPLGESDGSSDDRGLSDLAVLSDGRVLVSVSIERTVRDGDDKKVHEVGGALWVTPPHPWRTAGPWTTREIARFDDHKPEGVVALSPSCTAVVFDDDEKVKKQARKKRNGGPEWASRAAFVRYVRVSSGP